MSKAQTTMLQRCGCGGNATHSGECESCRRAGKTQRSGLLAVNQPGDRYEREADRAAEAVLHGKSRPAFSLSRLSMLQREDKPAQPSEEEKLAEAGKKLGEAFLATPVGKELVEKVKRDPLVAGAKELGEAFIGTLPGKIITGTAAVGVVSALAAMGKPLPAQPPAIPLDVLAPGLKVQITYEGPVNSPTKAMISFSYSQPSPTKKPALTESERYRAETARMAADQARFREGLRTADQKAEDDAIARAALANVTGRPRGPNIDAIVERTRGLQQPQPGGLQLQMPRPTFGAKPPALLGEGLKLAPLDFKLSGEQPKKKEDDPALQRKEAAGEHGPHQVAPPIVESVLDSPGQPLDGATQALMESRFGADFSRVRVHSDARAAESARAVSAHAYTVGRDVVFGSGGYAPATSEGRRLLAHELAHVVQQGSARLEDRSQLLVGARDNAFERDADHATAAVARGVRPGTNARLPVAQVQRGFWGDFFSREVGPFKALARLFGGEKFSASELQEYLALLEKNQQIEGDYDSDNKARAIVKRQTEFQPLSTEIKTLLIQEMLKGATLGGDEKAIIGLLRAATSAERKQIVEKIGRTKLWGDFSGDNRRTIEALTLTAADFADEKLVARYKRMSAKKLAEYRDSAAEPDVKSQFAKLIALQKITTELSPGDVEIDQAGAATMQIHEAAVNIMPDEKSDDPDLENEARTTIGLLPGSIDNVQADQDNNIVSWSGPGKMNVTIKTVYGPGITRGGPSKHGRGTTVNDRAAGNTSVQFHESQHGADYLQYLRNHPVPTFQGKVGDTVDVFNKAMDDYDTATKAYTKDVQNFSIRQTDCPGDAISSEMLAKVGASATICRENP